MTTHSSPTCSVPCTEPSDVANGCCAPSSQYCAPDQASTRNSEKIAGTASVTSGAAVFACAACCAIPLMFPAVASTSAGALLAWVGRGSFAVTVIAIVTVAASWLWLWRRAAKNEARVSRATVKLMALATLGVVAAVVGRPIGEVLLSRFAGL